MKAKWIIESAGKGAYRIVEDGEIRGFALLMANGAWCAFDKDEGRLTPEQFVAPVSVRAWFRDNYGARTDEA